jgi:hypothetical protein
MRTVALALQLAAILAAQSPQPSVSVSGFRLGYVLRIYLAGLGTDEASRFVRDQLAGAILNRTRLELQTDPTGADAVLLGTAIVTNGFEQWAVGSSSFEAAATAAASQGRAASAAAVTSNSRFAAGGGTVRITELGLQLAAPDGRILWAYDGSRCLAAAAVILTGAPRKKSATVCAAEQLVKAIDNDAKAARRGR